MPPKLILYLCLFLFPIIIALPSVIVARKLKTPRFVGSINNVTIPVGDEAVFTCTVENLNRFLLVAWIRVERRKFLALGMDIVNHNKRVRVTHPDRRTWNLHIKDTRESDSGYFMCKINSTPNIYQIGFLHVKAKVTTTPTTPKSSEHTNSSALIQKITATDPKSTDAIIMQTNQTIIEKGVATEVEVSLRNESQNTLILNSTNTASKTVEPSYVDKTHTVQTPLNLFNTALSILESIKMLMAEILTSKIPFSTALNASSLHPPSFLATNKLNENLSKNQLAKLRTEPQDSSKNLPNLQFKKYLALYKNAQKDLKEARDSLLNFEFIFG